MDENKNNAGKVVSIFLLLFFTVGQVILHYTYYDYILPIYKHLFLFQMTTQAVIFITLNLLLLAMIVFSTFSKPNNKYRATINGFGIYILWGELLLFMFGTYLKRFDRVLSPDVVYPSGVGLTTDTLKILNRQYDSLNYIYSKGYHYY